MTNRVLMGKHPDSGTVGLWISKPGKDARTSTVADDFLFDPSKYLNRPYVKFTAGVFSRGAFVQTISFLDGTKADSYLWDAGFVHGLGYVPFFTVQRGGDVTDPWADATRISLGLNGQSTTGYSMFRYNGSDPTKTPIAGTISSGYDPVTQTYTFNVTHSIVSVYRIPLF